MSSAIGKLALASAAFLLAILVAEGVVRIVRPQWRPSVSERALFWTRDRDLGWAHRKGVSGRYRGPDWDVDVRINAQGLRDVDHDYLRSPRHRVLVLGDSFAWGYGVGQDEMLTARLGELCPTWEFINGAVSGYGTDQQYLFYEKEGHRYRPDDVLLLIYGNDLMETSCPTMYGYPKPYFVRDADGGLELRNVPVPDRTLAQRLHAWLSAHSFLWSYYSYSSGLAVRMDAGCAGRVDFPLNEAVLHAFVEQVRRSHADFLWVLIPPRPGVQGAVLQEFYPRIARREGVRVLDLGPPLAAAAERGEELTLWEDPHWNAAGHRVVADAIADQLACTQ